uniref:Uncharacterized protein n=1 Tax=Glossina pallidipes TaxID=7398 RepID=A0A1B0A1G4_GLOPL
MDLTEELLGNDEELVVEFYDMHEDIAKLLLQYKAKPNAKTNLGWTPLLKDLSSVLLRSSIIHLLEMLRFIFCRHVYSYAFANCLNLLKKFSNKFL